MDTSHDVRKRIVVNLENTAHYFKLNPYTDHSELKGARVCTTINMKNRPLTLWVNGYVVLANHTVDLHSCAYAFSWAESTSQ
jgi:hypothetical protein